MDSQAYKTRKSKEFTFYTLNTKNQQHKISCHGKPTREDLTRLKDNHGVNYVLTILHDGENPKSIQSMCNDLGINWLHLPLKGANLAVFRNKDTHKAILQMLKIIHEKMSLENVTLFVHCAAGIHRTGTVLYCILRMLDESQESAVEALGLIRKVTKEKVGKHRIEYAEKYIVSDLGRI